MAGKGQVINQSKSQMELSLEEAEFNREEIFFADEQPTIAPTQADGGVTPIKVGQERLPILTREGTVEPQVEPQQAPQSNDRGDNVVGEFNTPSLTPEALGELQHIREAPPSIQSHFDMPMDSGFIDETDIIKAWGPVHGPQVVESLLRVTDGSDALNTARMDLTEHRQQNVQDAMEGVVSMQQDGFNFGDIHKPAQEGEATLDKDGKIKLTQQSLLIGPQGLNAATYTGDHRSVRVDPDYLITAFAVLEPLLHSNNELIPQDLIDSLSRDDIKDLGLREAAEESQAQTIESMGKSIHDMWYATRAYRESGPGTIVDPANKNKLTSEAYSLAGLHALQMYAQANPHVLEKVPYDETGEFFQITKAGKQILEERRKLVAPPRLSNLPLIDKPSSKGQSRHARGASARATTGQQIKTDPRHETRLHKAAEYYSSVKHVVGNVRGKIAFAFGLKAIEEGAQATVEGPNDHFTEAADYFDIGQKRIDKIKSIYKEAQYKLDEVNDKIFNLAEAGGGGTARMEFLTNKAQALAALIEEASKPEWQQAMYQLHATRQLEMLNDLALHKDHQISFTFSRQLANSRLTMQQQVMNPQSHKIARNVLGSSTLYEINPFSRSDEDWAMLVSFGATLFNQANYAPPASYERMRARIKSGSDPQMKIVEQAGKELGYLLLDYETKNTVDALSALEANEGGVFGVDNLLRVPELEHITAALDDVSDSTKGFLESAREHPDEFVSILESAVEFARYMDARRNNKTFTSQMRPIEVDGISNGLAALLAQLGMMAPMFRVGVLRQDPNMVLSDYQGIEGDLRDLFKHNLLENAHRYFTDFKTMETHGISDSDFEVLQEAITLAVEDKANFLKPPMMTLPYGQALDSMISQAYKTILESQRLTQIADDMGHQKLAEILHTVMVGELKNTLGKEVTDYIEALQDMTEYATLLDEPVVYTQAVGTKTSISKRKFVQDEVPKYRTRVRAKDEEGNFKETPKGSKADILSHSSDLTMKSRSMLTASASKGGIPGAYTRSAGAPQVVIGLDGATLVNLATGEVIAKLRNANNGRDPYILPIFDAVVTDLGSFKSVVEGLNEVWSDLVLKYDLIEELQKGFKTSRMVGLKRLEARAKDDPQGKPRNSDHTEYVVSHIEGILRKVNSKDPHVAAKAWNDYGDVTIGRLRKFINGIESKARKMKTTPSDVLTNSNMYSIAQVLLESDHQKKLATRFSAIQRKSRKGRKAIMDVFKESYQYNTDNVKMKYDVGGSDGSTMDDYYD